MTNSGILIYNYTIYVGFGEWFIVGHIIGISGNLMVFHIGISLGKI